jgi:hypothetical protein
MFSKFIDRPVLTVLSIIIVILGSLGLISLRFTISKYTYGNCISKLSGQCRSGNEAHISNSLEEQINGAERGLQLLHQIMMVQQPLYIL